MKAKIIRPVRYGTGGVIRRDEILSVRRMPAAAEIILYPNFQCIDGEHAGLEIPHLNCVLLPEEKTYTEAEYDTLLEEFKLARQENVMHRENVRALMAERDELRQRLDAQKPTIPQDVAEAIDTIRKNDMKWSSYSIFDLLDKVNAAIRNPGRCGPLVQVIANWVTEDISRRDTLVKTLVNGYTVEQSEKELERETIRKWYKGALLREKDGRDQDGFAKEAIEEVALYLGGCEIIADMSGFCRNQLAKKK